MLISKAEMVLLKTVGVFMDAPAKMPGAEISGIWDFSANEMLERGYLKYYKESNCLRLTESGAEILRCEGIEVSEYMPQSGRALERRLQGAEMMLFLSELGIDTFLIQTPKKICEPVYLSSVMMRRQKFSNVLGMSKFFGLLYSAEITYAVYNVSDSAEMLSPKNDEDVFTREILSANAPTEILYVSDKTLIEMAESVVNTPTAKKKSCKCGFCQAIERFDTSVCLVPMNDAGVNQLRIMLTEDYKAKLARYMINVSYSPVLYDFADAKFEDKHLLVFIDFNVKRLEDALKHLKKLYVLTLEEQLPALEVLLKGRKVRSIKKQTHFRGRR
jgi:thiol-disulfide isomerase/thioredoxin